MTSIILARIFSHTWLLRLNHVKMIKVRRMYATTVIINGSNELLLGVCSLTKLIQISVFCLMVETSIL